MSPEKTPLQQNSPEKMSPDMDERQKAIEFLKDKSELISEINQMIAIFKEHELDKLPLEELEEMKEDVEVALKEEKENEATGDTDIQEEIEKPAESEAESTEEGVKAQEEESAESRTDDVEEDASEEEKAKARGALIFPQTEEGTDSPTEKSEELSEQSDDAKKEVESESVEKKEQKLLAENAEPKSPIDAWENEPEQMDKFKHFTREDMAELIKNGATAGEIWEQAKDAGVFFKFDGSSYYLSQSSKGEKRKWRRRSGNNNTSDGHYEDKMFKYIESSVEDYKKLQEAYPSLEDVFIASNMLQAYDEKPTMNKMMSMSEYWDEIAKTITGYEASESKEAESEDNAAADLSSNQENMNPEKPSDSSGAESEEQKSEPKEESDSVEKNVSNSEIKSEEESEVEEVISKEEYKKFIHEGVVTDSVVDHLAKKVKNSEQLTDRENEIFTDKTSEINERIKKAAEIEEDTGNYDTEGQVEKSKTPESAEEKYIPKVGDDVYLMDSEDKLSRRWSESKKVIDVEERSGKIYVEVEGEDDLFFAGKLKRDKASENDQNESNASTEDASNISNEVAGKFQEQFQISAQELETVPGFSGLTTGQQKLVLDNFRKMTLSRIQEEGVKEYREDLKHSGTFARMGKSFLSSYYKAKSQSGAGAELLTAGINTHRDALSDIVAKTKESGLELDGNGEVIFIAEAPFDNLSLEDNKVINSFNEAAKNFSRVSDSWRYEDIITENVSGSTRSEYQVAREEYQSALRAYIDFARKSKGEEGVREAMEIDKKVRFTQFFAGDENYEDALQKIKDEPAWRRMFDNVGLEKGGYLALGFGSRTAAYGTLGTVIAPLTAIFTAAGLGAYRARSKAIEALEDEALVRRGGGDASLSRNTNSRFATMGKSENQAEVINTVSAEQLTSKLRNLLDRLDDPDLAEEERDSLVKQLHRRVQYTSQKIEGGTDKESKKEYAGGLVDYGDASGRAGRQYDLLQTLSEAQAVSLLDTDPDIKDDIANRLDRYLAYKDEKTRRYVTEKSTQGAVFGATFAGIGASIAGFFSGEDAADVASQAPESANADEFPGPVSPADGDVDALTDPKVFPEGAEDGSAEDWPGPVSPEESVEGVEEADSDTEMQPITPEAGPEALGVQEVSINNKGEGMIHAIANKLEADFDVSREQAMRIGNELYIKGEQLGDNDQMFNLVGKGASFSLDFGELTADELQEGAAQDLVENIEFSQETFEPGPTGIKGLDLPQQEAADQASAGVGGEDISRQTESIEKRSFDPETIHKYDTSSFGDLNTRTVGMDLERFQEVLDTNNVTQDIHDRLDEGINSSRMSANSTYEGIRVSALSDLRDYLYANSDKGIIDMIEGMREENPRLLITLDKVIALEDPDYGTPMHQLDRFITTGYLEMYASSEDVSIPRPGPETASDVSPQPAAQEASASDTADARPENPIQRKNIDGMTIAEANEQAVAADKEAWRERVNANKNIDVTTVGEAQNSPTDAGSNLEQVRDEFGKEEITFSDTDSANTETTSLNNVEVLTIDADKISIDDLRTLAAEMEAQSVVESGYIDVPTERLDALEAFLADNISSKPSEIIQKMADDNPELLTVFERAMNSADISDIADSESFQSLHKLVQHHVSELSEDDFPNGMPQYARTSIDVSILRLQE